MHHIACTRVIILRAWLWRVDIVDVSRPEMLRRRPDAVRVIYDGGALNMGQIVIRRVELRMYVQPGCAGDKRGSHTLVTALVQTDSDCIEMTFDEGFGGQQLLDANAELLVSHLGLSALLLRSSIAIRSHAQYGCGTPGP